MSAAETLGECQLHDLLDGCPGTNKVRVSVEKDSFALLIHPEGYGVYDGEYAPISLERHEGKLRLIVCADINDQEPTHIIDLDEAKEANRNIDYSFNESKT